jgi:hypothetical protein
MILFVSTAVLYLPVVLLVLALLVFFLGREDTRSCTGAVFLIGFVALPITWLYGVSDFISYRCPRCDRRLPSGVPQHQPEPNVCYICEDCRIAWDLGWGFAQNA